MTAEADRILATLDQIIADTHEVGSQLGIFGVAHYPRMMHDAVALRLNYFRDELVKVLEPKGDPAGIPPDCPIGAVSSTQSISDIRPAMWAAEPVDAGGSDPVPADPDAAPDPEEPE